jgi:hypothetical protein
MHYTGVMKKTGCSVLVLMMMSISAHAADLTVFSGVQHVGKVSLSTPGNSGGAASQILTNPFNSGTFGIRASSGAVVGHEETIEYSPNFIDSSSKAFILASNVVVTVPAPVLKPYATAGFGTVIVRGTGPTDFGAKFAINYGGGVKVLPAGPLGVRGDVRGYTLFGIDGHKMNVVEVSLGVLFHF